MALIVGCGGRERLPSQVQRRDSGVDPTDGGEPFPDGGEVKDDPDSGVPPPDSGTPDSGAAIPDAGDVCTDGPFKQARAGVFYGTDLPSYVTLTAGQIQGIGSFDFCSGTLIAPTWVLTAKHCEVDLSSPFCVGTTPSNPNVCINPLRVIDHPSGDLTLVELVQPAADRLATVETIPVLTETIDLSWVGRMAEAAGYGQDENGNFGRREFTAEPIADVFADELTIDGQGTHGVCFGDSGGPVMVVASDGSVRVGGALSDGDESCVGMDNFTRVDPYLQWIESYVGTVGPQPCGSVTSEGLCSPDRGRATWCDANGQLASAACGPSDVCGWSQTELGWRCIDPASDPCGGVTFDGECSGNMLRWCDHGQPLERDCGACAETCLPGAQSGYYCVASNCGDTDYLGRCDGNVAVWCSLEGVLQQENCSASNSTCRYIDDETGYYCD